MRHIKLLQSHSLLILSNALLLINVIFGPDQAFFYLFIFYWLENTFAFTSFLLKGFIETVKTSMLSFGYLFKLVVITVVFGIIWIGMPYFLLIQHFPASFSLSTVFSLEGHPWALLLMIAGYIWLVIEQISKEPVSLREGVQSGMRDLSFLAGRVKILFILVFMVIGVFGPIALLGKNLYLMYPGSIFWVYFFIGLNWLMMLSIVAVKTILEIKLVIKSHQVQSELDKVFNEHGKEIEADVESKLSRL